MEGSFWSSLWTVFYAIVLTGLSLYGLHRYVIVYLYLKYRNKPPQPAGRFDQLPLITVQLPVFNELYVVERLLDAVAALDYPKELLQVQVLDDSTDDTVRLAAAKVEEMKQRGFDIEHIHRTDRTGFKAGALENGMSACRGDFILILDADFVPTPEMLQKTVHYFTDPKVGMIQTRWGHINKHYSLLTRLQAMFLDGHLLLEQTARSRSGRFFNFNGTAGLWRKSCIAEAGGWQHDTLTEDLDLSYRAQVAGWRFVFLADLITPAELPVDMNGFKSQQHRWTKGSIQTCMKLLPGIWRSPLPLLIKLEATAHLTSNYAYLLLFFLCVLMHPGASLMQGGTAKALLLDIAIFLAASFPATVFYLVTQRELDKQNWLREAMYLPALLALGIGLAVNNAKAVLEASLGHQSEFTRTPKYGVGANSPKIALPKKKTGYIPIKNLLPIIELGFAVWFGHFLYIEITRFNWLSVPFLLLFTGGFAYVALASIAQWLPSNRQEARI